MDYINSIYDYHAALSELSRNVGRDVSLDYGKKVSTAPGCPECDEEESMEFTRRYE